MHRKIEEYGQMFQQRNLPRHSDPLGLDGTVMDTCEISGHFASTRCTARSDSPKYAG
jgi:hypothetical protein